MRILIIGNKGSGKTTAGNLIAFIPPDTQCQSISCSDIIIADFALTASVPPSHIIAHKDEYRDRLWRYARAIQEKNPTDIVRKALFAALMQGEPQPWDLGAISDRWDSPGFTVVTGVRNKDEIDAIREEKLFNLIIWIDRDGCTPDSTDQLTAQSADIVVPNNGTPDKLRDNLLQAISIARKTY